MDFNATIDIIIKDLEEAREIIDDLKHYQGVPVLQVELAKSKCRSAGEIIALLKNQNTEASPVITPVSADAIDIEITSAVIDFRSPVVAPPVTPAVAPTVTPAVAPTVTHASTPIATPAATPVAKDIIMPPVTVFVPPVIIPPLEDELKKDTKKTTKKISEAAIIADKFNSLKNINEQMGGNKTDEDLSGHLKTKPLTTLLEGIGLNDKFLFISEIFDGNRDEYTKAITQLDKVESLSDARAVIMSYTGENNENEAVKQLLNLVKRKIPSNE